ncbi:hypothetical protein [Burkholderia anthina]|nr:hypothetical protein [Burkholderia anthina]
MSITTTFRNLVSGLGGSAQRSVALHFRQAQRAVGHLLALRDAERRSR